MAIEITDDLVKQIARLSRLAISAEEVVGLQSHFEKILSFIAAFQALDTTGIDPSIFSGEASNVYREDGPRVSLPREDALANAPRSDGTYFVVPRIVGGADEEDDAGGLA